MSSWPEPVERVAAVLRRSGVEAKIEAFTATAQIVTAVVIFCDKKPAAALLPGDRRLSLEKVARATSSERVRLAAAAEVLEITGFELGVVPPFPLPRGFRVFLDRSLVTARRIWVGAGSPSHLLACTPGDLNTLSGAELLDVVDAGG